MLAVDRLRLQSKGGSAKAVPVKRRGAVACRVELVMWREVEVVVHFIKRVTWREEAAYPVAEAVHLGLNLNAVPQRQDLNANLNVVPQRQDLNLNLNLNAVPQRQDLNANLNAVPQRQDLNPAEGVSGHTVSNMKLCWTRCKGKNPAFSNTGFKGTSYQVPFPVSSLVGLEVVFIFIYLPFRSDFSLLFEKVIHIRAPVNDSHGKKYY